MRHGNDVERLRENILKRRALLAPAEHAGLSSQVVDRFLAECGIASWKGLTVALYRAVRGELELTGLEARLTLLGARLCFPRVLDPGARSMEFAEVPAQDPSAWAPGAYGIQEPADHHPAIEASGLDVIFVPGVVFGLGGERLGMGGGYYDRYLPGAPRALKVALGFDFQLVDKIDQQAWDQPVDWIWTERRKVVRRRF